MDNIINSILSELPEWAKVTIAIISIIGVSIAFIFIIYTIWKFAKAVDKESKVFDLSKQNQKLLEENRQIRYFSTLLKTNFELLDEIIPTLEIQISRIQDVFQNHVNRISLRALVSRSHAQRHVHRSRDGRRHSLEA